MRIVVTGASGFIGARVLAPLRQRGFEVHAVGRRAPAADVVFHHADLFDPAETDAALHAAAATHLLHLAWYAEPGVYWRSAKNLDWVAASLRLIQSFAAAGGRRAVLAGTCAEYQWGPPRFDEWTAPIAPATLYGTAKDALRRLAMSYGETTLLSVAWARLFFLYGPGEPGGRLVSGAIASLLAGKPFPTSHGHQRRDYLHVDDVAGALAALAGSEVTGPVNVASGMAVPVRSILERVGAEIGRAELIRYGALPLSATEPTSIEGDNKRLTDEVGFTPAYQLEPGIRSALDWWKLHRASID